MEDENRACKTAKPLVVSLLIVLVLVSIGYKLASEETRNTDTRGGSESDEHNYIPLVFGILTVAFGSVYFFVGLIVVAELALDFATWFRPEHVKNEEANNNQGQEQKTVFKLTIQTSVTIASMFLLTWAIHHGYKLTVEGPKAGIYNGLAFLIGFITIGFGFVYFVIGIGLIAESTVHLSGRLQQVIQSDINQNQEDIYAYLALC